MLITCDRFFVEESFDLFRRKWLADAIDGSLLPCSHKRSERERMLLDGIQEWCCLRLAKLIMLFVWMSVA